MKIIGEAITHLTYFPTQLGNSNSFRTTLAIDEDTHEWIAFPTEDFTGSLTHPLLNLNKNAKTKIKLNDMEIKLITTFEFNIFISHHQLTFTDCTAMWHCS